MTSVILPRTWRARAHGRTHIFAKGDQESQEHVLMKIFLWALYLPQYPEVRVEVTIGGHYKPDLVQLRPLDPRADPPPLFWGEAGQVGASKLDWLTRRCPDTHVVIAKWGVSLMPTAAAVRRSLRGIHRTQPLELLSIPADAGRFIDIPGGTVAITFDDLSDRQRFM